MIVFVADGELKEDPYDERRASSRAFFMILCIVSGGDLAWGSVFFFLDRFLGRVYESSFEYPSFTTIPEIFIKKKKKH